VSRPLCLFGHTHVQVVYRLAARALSTIAPNGMSSSTLHIDAGATYFVNPGAVGQPRDGDPRAGVAVVDTGTECVELHRVPYPVEAAQSKILAAGLPSMLADRLGIGR
jgi:diadenosine tetraphosphatase ApaH/serine/threonine PP2A family protein phosphatase